LCLIFAIIISKLRSEAKNLVTEDGERLG
jgi:hypothetical protein